MRITQFVKDLVAKLPPDVLQHPLPFPDRLDYAEKLIQEAFDAHIAELLTTWKADFGNAAMEIRNLRRQLEVMEMTKSLCGDPLEVALHALSLIQECAHSNMNNGVCTTCGSQLLAL